MNQEETRYGGEHQGHGSHRWGMIACCIPMLGIAIALVATGAWDRRSS